MGRVIIKVRPPQNETMSSPSLDTHFHSFPLHCRFTEVRTNGNSTWRTGSWIWMGETMCSLKPLEMQNGEGKKRHVNRSGNALTHHCTRYFNILPHPGTRFVSGNFFWVFENSYQSPKDREASQKAECPQTLNKPCGMRIRQGGRRACEWNVLHPFVVCCLFQASSLSLLSPPTRENTHKYESRSFT